MKVHRKAMWGSLAGVTAVLTTLLLKLGYSEDISDFLPLGTSDREAMSVYQNISGADKFYVIFSNPGDADLTVSAMDSFVEKVQEADTQGWTSDLTCSFDMEKIRSVFDFVLDNAPYFMTEEDYARADSLLSEPGYLNARMAGNYEQLMFPSAGVMSGNVAADPLGLFTPVLGRLSKSDSQLNFEMYDGHIFSPDMSRAIAMMSSPFGNSETEMNSRLLDMMENAAEQISREYPGVTAHITGGPQIAVGNASRIKTDSIIAVSLSIVLIVLILIFSFNSFRNILLVFLSIGWGWLFAMGGIALFSDKVSIIVIGISSVILGIAVNYPLHLIVHTAYQNDIKKTIREIMVPLVIGNVTTVGAFLALLPLKSTALRDLGLFAALLLAGTIIFSLVYLPHLVKVEKWTGGRKSFIDRVAGLSPERNKIFVAVIAALTMIFGIFSLNTQFDSDLTHINYMTPGQKADMQYFQNLLDGAADNDVKSLYVLSKGSDFDQALAGNLRQEEIADSLATAGIVESCSGIADFIVPEAEQLQRLERWNGFVASHRKMLTEDLHSAAFKAGFAADAFDRFSALADGVSMQARDISWFAPLTGLVFSRNAVRLEETGACYIVNEVKVKADNMELARSSFSSSFDAAGINNALSSNLSDNFNYIGIACSLIVFLFLWFSFGRIELAIISFLPMAVSWLWILGLMSIFGIKFNIVNIILATFIFGQGDDYTIFITEGCQWEYAHGRPILKSYKSSILRSALIMFVGIGTLIVAKHPAMKSLAQVTIIGMSSVVLMAWVIPPLLMKWLTTRKGVVRKRPLSFDMLLHKKDTGSLVLGRYLYKGSEIYSMAKRSISRAAAIVEEHPAVDGVISVEDCGYGETALYLALSHPQARVIAKITDEDRRQVACIAADGFVDNIEFIKTDNI